MKNVGRPIVVTSLALLLPLLALPTHVLPGTSPFMLCSALFIACGQPQFTWVDEVEHALGTFLEQKYPASDVSLHLNAPDRVRVAVGRGGHRMENIETSLLLTMLAHHAQGIDEAAADELFSSRSGWMPDEEYGMIFPEASRSETGISAH